MGRKTRILAECIVCRKNEYIVAKGMCSRCYQKQYYIQNRDYIIKRNTEDGILRLREIKKSPEAYSKYKNKRSQKSREYNYKLKRCPHCRKQIEVRKYNSKRGNRIRICPKCSNRFLVSRTLGSNSSTGRAGGIKLTAI